MLSVSVSNTKRSVRAFNPDNKIFLITLDGFRWEEVFRGADSALVHDPSVTTDTSLTRAMFWADTETARRKKLLPFFWNVVAKHGQLYGNRIYDNKVNVSNPYSLSYPGYNELLTGSVDISIYGNSKKENSNRNILELINSSPQFAGKVAAFTSWDVFPYILNSERNTFYINSGHQKIENADPGKETSILNKIQSQLAGEKRPTRYDELTFIACREYLLKNKPSVLFLSFSGTDDAGHEKKYDQYLQQANNADRMISELWRLVQSMPEYRDRTTFIITTDHGRGNKKSTWSRHGFLISGSSQTWFALLGNSIVPGGEIKTPNQAYQKDIKSLIMEILTRKDGTLPDGTGSSR
ncbi:MAG TPA: alkaline phosphatase family protein [Flavisolibacter sp.]